jgi:mercuric ion binding protein
MIPHMAAIACAIAFSALPALSAEKTIVLNVEKADCLGASIVRMALLKMSGVKEVQVVESKAGSPAVATVIFDNAITTVEVLSAATTDAGFPSHIMN